MGFVIVAWVCVVKQGVAFEVWAGLIWFVIGVGALVMPLVFPVQPAPLVPAFAEIVFCGPVAGWMSLLAAHSLYTGRWQVQGRVLAYAREPVTYWVFHGVAVMVASTMLVGFTRGFLSLALYL